MAECGFFSQLLVFFYSSVCILLCFLRYFFLLFFANKLYPPNLSDARYTYLFAYMFDVQRHSKCVSHIYIVHTCV